MSSREWRWVWKAALLGFLLLATITTLIKSGRGAPVESARAASLQPSSSLSTLPKERGELRRVLRLPPFQAEKWVTKYPSLKGKPLRFAEPEEVDVDPSSHGVWERDGEMDRWRFRIEAPGALNLNLAFGQYRLPKSATLELRDSEGRLLVRPFTAADNELHGELWTPVVAGEQVELQLSVAPSERREVELRLRRVNRGFRRLSFAAGKQKIGDNFPDGDCHIDVVCSASESGVGPVIDAYRDQIRSAGVYTLLGVDTCSGAAINNTREDRRPFFLVAAHCDVSPFNASSMVVYWNFENSTCRPKGSFANGWVGDGPVDSFNTGAIFRASYLPSDMTLVELDDPLDPSHQVFLAGWSRTGIPSMAVGIHFPATAEKRISFDFHDLQPTEDYSNQTSPLGTHWRVINWEHGSTEGGSSGSPLFDQHGRIVGQLDGGDAACGNRASDWYGRLGVSWIGGRTLSSSLSGWLDPIGTNVQTLDGLDQVALEGFVEGSEVNEGHLGTRALRFTIRLSEPAEERIDLRYSTRNGSATAGSDYTAISNGRISFFPGEQTKTVSVSVRGDRQAEEDEYFTLAVSVEGEASVVFPISEARGTIRNDDYVPPQIVGPSSAEGVVGHLLELLVETRNTPTSFRLISAPEGMTIGADGVIRWTPSKLGTYQMRVVATNPAGSNTRTIEVEVLGNPLLAAWEVEGIAITSGGDASWSRRASPDSVIGDDSGESGDVSDSESTWAQIEVEGPDFVGFWWKVSSEQYYDGLSVLVGDTKRANISGEEDWQYHVVAVPPGKHVVRWIYEKDSSRSVGEDRGWVDAVQVGSLTPDMLMEPPTIHVKAGTNVDYVFPTRSIGRVTFGSDDLPDGFSLSPNGELTGRATTRGTHRFTLQVTVGSESWALPGRIVVVNEPSLGPALGQPDLPWFTSGQGFWSSQTLHSLLGPALQENGVSDGERLELSTYVMGPGRVSFWWRASSEEGADGLEFSVNGVEQAFLSGQSSWKLRSFDLGFGRQRLTWSYRKDATLKAGLDGGWVDGVSFAGYTTWAIGQGLGLKNNPTLDPDRDGMNLLFEYATGRNPQQWERIPEPVLVGNSLEWSVDKAAGIQGVGFEVAVSSDLKTWNRRERRILTNDESRFHARDNRELPVNRTRYLRGLVFPAN